MKNNDCFYRTVKLVKRLSWVGIGPVSWLTPIFLFHYSKSKIILKSINVFYKEVNAVRLPSVVDTVPWIFLPDISLFHKIK